MNINHADIQILPIHNHPEFLLPCCELINSEWSRSEGARLHSLQSSCDTLPTSLVMVYKSLVIGHCKLSKMPVRESCFVESVVIERNLRGSGLGTLLMLEAEKYCAEKLNLNTIYLSTKGQEKFYQKLGYTECKPVNIYGSSVQNVQLSQISSIKSPPPPPLPKTFSLPVSKKTYMCKSI